MNCSREDEEDPTPPRKIAKISSKHRQQKFRDAWLMNDNFKQWLMKVPNDEYKAKCRTCNATMNSELTVLKNHMASKVHLRNPPDDSIYENTMQDIRKCKKEDTTNKMDENFAAKIERANSTNEQNIMNECDIYGQLLAQKLMKLDEVDRMILMNNIDNLVFQTVMQAKGKLVSPSNMSSSNHSLRHQVYISKPGPYYDEASIVVTQCPLEQSMEEQRSEN